MRIFTPGRRNLLLGAALAFSLFSHEKAKAQTLAFPGAEGFGRFAKGARGAATRDVYVVTNLNDAGAGSFRDAVSQPGRIVVFAVGGIVNLLSDVVVKNNIYIAGQTAPGDGIVFFGKRVTFTGATNTIARYLRVRLGANNISGSSNQGNDASGLANGSDMVFDHMSFTWGMDEVFSINWDSKGTAPDNITIQNSIIGQGLHRDNHSAGGLIQTPDGGKVSLLKNLYISNKTRNPKVKGVNEFVNNVVYNWGNGNRLDANMNYGWSGDAYIMGGSSGVSEVNVINNYFVGGPLTPPSKTTPFSRGTGTFNIWGSGNYFDNDRDGVLNGTLVPFDSTGYPGISGDAFQSQAFPYPAANPALSAAQAYQYIIDNVGANYPRRDQVDLFLVDEVQSKGTKGHYVYRQTDLPLANGGLGSVFGAPAPLDSDSDGMPDAWEDANGLNKNNKADAVAFSASQPAYLNIEVYVNSLTATPPPVFVKPPTALNLSATSVETPAPASTVVVKWTDNSDNEDFFVLERSADGLSYTDIYHPAAGATQYSDAGLTPNTTYYYRIKAVSGTEASAYATAVSVKTPQLPTAPSAAATPTPANGFQYAELAGGTITLKWTGSSNTTTYAVYFGTDPAALTKKADVAYSAAPSYQVSGLSDYETYYWRVDAVNAKGASEGAVWWFRTTKTFPSALVGHWSFDETEGREVFDSSSFANHGILGLDEDDESIRVPGKVKNALSFATASTDRYVVSVPHQDQVYLDKGSFSLSFWMKAAPALLPTGTNSAYILCKGSITKNAATGATGNRFNIECKSGELRFAIDDDAKGKDELATSGTPFFTGNWVHVVAIRDTTTKKLRVFLNGTFVKEQAITKAVSIGEASALVIGNIGELEFLSSANQPAPYKGSFDELKIFNYSLSDEQILNLFHTSPLPMQTATPGIPNGAALEGYSETLPVSWKGGLKTTGYKVYFGTDQNNLGFVADVPVAAPNYSFASLQKGTTYYWRVDAVNELGVTAGEVWSFKAVSPKGLVGHWSLDETAGTVAADLSSYRRNGTITAMPEATWSAGKFGNALLYKNPATTGAVSVPHAEHLLFNQNAFTISMWVKLTSGSSNYNSAAPAKDCYLIQKGQFTDPGGKWYGIQLRDSALVFSVDDAVAKSSVTVSIKKATAYNIFNNAWTNIAAVADTSSKLLRLYINGVQAASASFSGTATGVGKELPLLIGNSAENKPYHDLLDDVRLYNYALSQTDILKLVNAAAPVVQAAGTLDGFCPKPGTPSAAQTLAASGANLYGAVTITPPAAYEVSADGGTSWFTNASPLVLNGTDGTLAGTSISVRLNAPAAGAYGGNIAIASPGATTVLAPVASSPLLTPALGITASAASIHPGTTVTFTATPENGGTAPQYQWFKNGVVVPDATGDTFATNALANGDGIHAVLTSNEGCVATSTATGNTLSVPVLPLRLQVQHKDGDGGNTANNNLRPYLKIVNNDTVPVLFSELTARYWFTTESTSSVVTNIDWAKMGAANVKARYVALATPLTNATGYVEYSFEASAGQLKAGANSGEIFSKVYHSNWKALDELNDYSYAANSTYTAQAKITLYRNGQLIWGVEPAAGVPTAARIGLPEEAAQSSAFTVSAVRNPSTTRFTLAISGGDNSALTLRVFDLAGRMVEAKAGLAPNQTLQLGGHYRPGLYLAEVIQGNERRIVKLVKE
ncbi:LamG-like jellyroll fold domain-containing protein [Paraflavisolibacter sp. H34]|uniref:LamG-like jellyroll fold domain-containing protein n=1 Tax=Huijunlia imazamoxiresistens TaxID=3127457 RepID=UPI003015D521